MLGSTLQRALVALAIWSVLTVSGITAQAPQPCLVEDGDDTVLVGPRVTQINFEYAVRLRNGPNPLDVTAVEIFTGRRLGDTSISLHRHDAGADLPGAPVVLGGWWMSDALGWQGARFLFTVRIQPGEVFWVVWQAASGAALPVARVNRVTGDVHRTRQNFSRGVWSAATREWDWKIRLDCGGRRPGQLLTLGGPCGTGGVSPQLGSRQPVPVIGQVFELDVTLVRPGSGAWLGIAVRRGRWGGQLPPVDLTPFGAPGCHVGANLEQGILRIADASGGATVALGIPGQPALVGATFWVQWVSLDPAANPLGVLTSLTGEVRIGN